MAVSSGRVLAQNTTTHATDNTQSLSSSPIVLQNIVIGTASAPTDVLIADGKISRIGHALTAANAQSVDCTGCLLLPSFIDTHVHLDKTRFGAPERLHHIATASVAERAANERKLRVELKHDPYTYGSNLVRQMAAMGTTHLRSHIDIDPLDQTVRR
jgi:Cytosine deaminase and related metal-dependent hydrolases